MAATTTTTPATLPFDATSEWTVADGSARYALTPEAVADALPDGPRDVPLQSHRLDHGPDVRGGVQVLLRKRADGVYQLLLDGRESTLPPGQVVHPLPRFRMDDLAREDATGNRVPQPVRVGLLVEVGAQPPDVCKVQVVQRSFLNGIQTNYGNESVAMEAELRPFRPGDVECECLAVAYPMALTVPATLRIGDRQQARNEQDEERKAYVSRWFRALGTVVTGGFKSAMWGVFRTLSNQAQFKVAAAAAAAAVAEIQASGGGSGAISAVIASAALLNALARAALKKVESGVVTDQDAAGTASDGLPASARNAEISAHDLPDIIRRIGGYRQGGSRSNLGSAVTLSELRARGRIDDALVLQTLQRPFSSLDVLDAVRTELQEENVGTDAAPRQRTPAEVEDVLRPLSEAVRAGQQASKLTILPNSVSLAGMEMPRMRARGYVETCIRIQVVDGQQPGPQAGWRQFELDAGEFAFEAGVVASGYAELRDNLRRAIAEVRNGARFVNLQTSPLVGAVLERATQATTWREFLVKRWTGIGDQVPWPNVDALLNSLELLGRAVGGQLDALLPSVAPPSYLDTYPRAAAVRRLPHLVRCRNVSGMSFVMENDDGTAISTLSSEPVSRDNSGMHAVITASAATLRVVRRAIDQQLEAEGLRAPRTRLALRTRAFALPPGPLGAAARIGDRVAEGRQATAPLGILTRHVYNARLPPDVVDALAVRAAHPRIEEAARVTWLARAAPRPHGTAARAALARGDDTERTGASVARVLGLPVSHEAELVAGVIAELAARDALARTLDGCTLAPTRGQLMRTAVQAAVEQLRAARLLAKACFGREGQNASPWLGHDDCLFDCYPSGDALRLLLHELPSWRAWSQPWTVGNATLAASDRFVVLEARGQARPPGIAALDAVLEALGALQPSLEVPLDAFPFLATQTLCELAAGAPLVRCAVPQGVAASGEARVLAALAAHAEAAHEAASRIATLATGFRLPPWSERAALADCAAARPVLARVLALEVVSTASIPAGTPPAAVAVLDRPIAACFDDEAGPPLQRGVPTEPRAATVLDNTTDAAQRVLAARLAVFRFNIDGLASERALPATGACAEGLGDALLTRFAGLAVADAPPPAQRLAYLCPFGGGFLSELQPWAGRAFEDTPVFARHLADAGPPTDAAVRQATLLLRPADEPSQHPLVVTARHPQPGPSALGFLLSAASAAMRPEPPPTTLLAHGTVPIRTLRAAWNEAERARSVDAASAFLWNVERLVQAVLVLAGHGHMDTTTLTCIPPPPTRVRYATVPQAPTEPPTLVQARLNAQVLALSLVPQQFALLTAAVGIDVNTGAPVTLRSRLDAVDAKHTDARLPPGQREHISAILTFFEEYPASLSPEVRAWATPDRLALFATTSPPSDPNDRWWPARAASLSQFYQAMQAMRDAFAADVTKWTERVEPIRGENARREARAFEARQYELQRWPDVLRVAGAVTATLLRAPPRLELDVGAEDGPTKARVDASATAFARGVATCRARGLAAVPLSELAAVAVRVPPPPPQPPPPVAAGA